MAGNFAAAIPHREEERGGGMFRQLNMHRCVLYIQENIKRLFNPDVSLSIGWIGRPILMRGLEKKFETLTHRDQV
jgi:hypothetical protein